MAGAFISASRSQAQSATVHGLAGGVVQMSDVVEAIEAAVRRGDLAPFDALAGVLSRPYEDQLEHANLADPPGPEWRTYRTFCGT